MKKVVIAGGTGFIGRTLIREFCEAGYDVEILSRANRALQGAATVTWDGKTVGNWTGALEGAHAVINLCGESLLQRWTNASKKRMRDSRIGTTKLIGEAISVCDQPPKVWINISAVGWYGDTGNREVSEASPAGKDFLAQLCADWEGAVDQSDTPWTRQCKLRVGVVLGKGADVFGLLARLTKMMLGGTVGTGRQVLPWIHVRDLVRLIVWAAENEVSGVVNATAPNPVTNEAFMAALRKRFGMLPSPPVPVFVIELVCKLMGWESSMLLGGARAVPAIALSRGFKFDFPTLGAALDDLVDDVPEAWKSPDAMAI
jgi:uncharacterized protein